MAMARSLSETIKDTDIGRSWTKVQSTGTRRVTVTTVDPDGMFDEPGAFDHLSVALQLIGETVFDYEVAEADEEYDYLLDDDGDGIPEPPATEDDNARRARIAAILGNLSWMDDEDEPD